MSKIDELIKQLCPDGVELKKLWEVTYWDKRFNAVENYKQPQIVRYKYFLASELKPLIVEGGDIKILTTNISNLYTSEDLAEDNYSEGEIIAIPWGGNPIIQYYNGKFLTSDNRIAVSIDSNYLNTKYLIFIY
jgi:type I restriction enzyme S subunit